MRSGRRRVATLVGVAATIATSACSSAITQANLHAAEAADEVRIREPRGADLLDKIPGSPSALTGAEEPAFEKSVDLPSVEVAVLARHPSLVAAAHRVRAIVERARAEGSLPAPELMAEIWQIPFARPYALDKAGMVMFSVRQSIPAAGSLDLMAEATALQARAEVAKVSSEARMLVREADRAFADYAETTALHATHIAHRALLDQMIAAARARYTTGAPLSDVTKADLERARFDVHIAHEHGMIEAAGARLNGLLARPIDAPLGPPSLPPPQTTGLSLEDASARAVARSPELAAVELMEQSARTTVRAADREATIPAFMVGLDTFLPVNNMPAGYGASFSMSLPWLWGGASNRARSAQQQLLVERASRDSARLRVRTDVGTALASVRAAERQYVILQDVAAPAARRALEAARAGYASGGTDLLAWLDATRSSLDVDVELTTMRADLDRALADLDWAAGEHVPRIPIPTAKDERHE